MLQDERLFDWSSSTRATERGHRTSTPSPELRRASSSSTFPRLSACSSKSPTSQPLHSARRLYAGLAHGMPIDAAVGPARRAIMAMTTAEFGTPVLFLRDGDARLFDIDSAEPAVSAPPAEPEPVEKTAEPAVERSTSGTGTRRGTRRTRG